MPAEKMYLLDLGWLEGDIGWFLPGAPGGGATWSERNPPSTLVRIPVSAALIEHEDGLILFDGGPSPDANETRPVPTANFHLVDFKDEYRIENQLALLGYKTSDIKFVALSHLHWDHVGQLPTFKENKTPIIVQKKELEWALYSIWIGKGVYYTLEDMTQLIGAPLFPIADKSFDIADGVTLEWTGGHTPGHQIAKVAMKSGKNYILAGDYIHIPEEMNLEAKGWLLSDAEEWLVELRQLKLQMMMKNSEILISHDPKLWEKYPKAPKALP